MPKGKKHGVDEVIAELREAGVLMSHGQSQKSAAKAIGVSTPTLTIGDFNFDYDFRTQRVNKAFEAFLKPGE